MWVYRRLQNIFNLGHYLFLLKKIRFAPVCERKIYQRKQIFFWKLDLKEFIIDTQ